MTLRSVRVGDKMYGSLAVSEECYDEIAERLKKADLAHHIDEENKVIDMKDIGLLRGDY